MRYKITLFLISLFLNSDPVFSGYLIVHGNLEGSCDWVKPSGDGEQCAIVAIPVVWPYMCAPEVKEGNLKATERVLSELRDKFNKDASGDQLALFNNKINFIAKLKMAEEKIKAYLSFVVDNVDDAEEVAYFVGARSYDEYSDIKNQKYQKLYAKLGLSPVQAKEVVEALSTELKGNLK